MLASLFLAAFASCARSDEVPAAHLAPTRIVALTVGSVDALALLGELGRVVAVEEDCFVPGTEHLVKIRNDDHAGPSKALSVEAVLALHPDLVIAKEDLKPALGGRGLTMQWLPSSSDLSTIVPMVEELGDRLGAREHADLVVQAMRAKMRAIELRVANQPLVRVYFESGRPGRSCGRGTVVDDMIRLAGGINIAGEIDLANPTLSSEAIVAANPDVIILSPWSDSPDDVAARAGWRDIAAVRSGRVHRIPEEDRKIQYPSPSCVDGCDVMLVPWLHPELVGDIEPVERR